MMRTIYIPESKFKRSNFTATKSDGNFTIKVIDSKGVTVKKFRCNGYTIQVSDPYLDPNTIGTLI
jgi:hypothetical protein